MRQLKKRPIPMDKDKLFSQKGFQKALKESEHPDFEVDSIFDFTYKGKGDIKTAPKKKTKNRDKISNSFAKISNAGNYSTFYKHERY